VESVQALIEPFGGCVETTEREFRLNFHIGARRNEISQNLQPYDYFMGQIRIIMVAISGKRANLRG
jgi:hypothetical protein